MSPASKYWFLARYGVVGVSGGIVQIATLYLWVDVFHLETRYLLGATIGFCVALLVTFTLQKYWTFRDHMGTDIRRQFVVYTAIALLSLGLTILLLYTSKLLLERLGLDFFDWWYLLAQMVIIAVTAGMSFLANYFITFRTHL